MQDTAEAEHIKAFFNDARTDILSVSAIERRAGLPGSKVLDNFLQGRRPLPKARIGAIVAVLRQVGYVPVCALHESAQISTSTKAMATM